MEYYKRAKSKQEYYQSRLFSINWCVSIWMTIPTGKPDAFYEGVNPIWHLQEELDINNVSKLCKQNKWEF